MSSTTHEPALRTPTSVKGGQDSTTSEKGANSRQQFVVFALNMSWQLAIAVLAPVIGGVELGKKLGSPTAWVLAGLVVALIASGVVMWRTVQAANRLPVPKLTAEQKRAVQKSYEEDDD